MGRIARPERCLFRRVSIIYLYPVSSLTIQSFHSQKPGKIRIRVIDASLKIFLHDGYDWSRTRKAIEDEVRAVRRRLERIRQLLASGQKADESIENATSSILFNSVYIGLEQKAEMGLSRMGMGKMDEKALIAAIDEELDEMETGSTSSWQTLPAGVGAGPSAVHQAHKKTRLKGKRLTRSKKPQIEINLLGIKADVDLYPIEEPTSSRVHFTAKEMEILDHIKTSTWKKFLTEMKADSRGNIRETDADMLRIELVGVRLREDEEELRLRVCSYIELNRILLTLRRPKFCPFDYMSTKMLWISSNDSSASKLPL